MSRFGPHVCRASWTPGWVVPLLSALALSCGGSTATPSPSSELGTTACDHYVGALLGVTCNFGPVLPPSEVTRIQQTFAPVCQSAKQAPGSTLSDAQLDACATALEGQCAQLNVDPSLLDACAFRGSLAAGEPCSAGAQCQSGFCGEPMPGDGVDGGTIDAGLPTGACGFCVAPAALGQPCAYGLCVAGATCPTLTNPNPVCASDVPGGLHAACGQATGACQTGLTCDDNTNLCEPTQWVGEDMPCPMGPGQCKVGLYCSAMPQNRCSAPLPAGHPCDPRVDICGAGLLCLGDQYAGTCSTPTWVADGQACTTPTSACLHGSCANTSGCPTLVGIGQTCDGVTTVCDDFADCGLDFTCHPLGALGCQVNAYY
jgi:hypothetical protein